MNKFSYDYFYIFWFEIVVYSLSFLFLFIFREDMEKVNIKFHDNYTVTYQHKKILQFVPELSIDRNVRVMTPNIPLLVWIKTSFISNYIHIWIKNV